MRMIVLLYAERLPEWFTAGQMRSIMGTDGRLTNSRLSSAVRGGYLETATAQGRFHANVLYRITPRGHERLAEMDRLAFDGRAHTDRETARLLRHVRGAFLEWNGPSIMVRNIYGLTHIPRSQINNALWLLNESGQIEEVPEENPSKSSAIRWRLTDLGRRLAEEESE